MYDLIVIGAGPAGLAAALDAHYLKLKTLVIEADKAGGALSQSYPWKGVDSYLGFHEKRGHEISDIIVNHVRKCGAKILEKEHAEKIDVHKGKFTVTTTKGKYESRTVIVATGIGGTPKRTGAKGENLKGVIYTVKDSRVYKGKNVIILGGGDSAADTALALDEAGANVTMAHRKDDLRATDENKDSIKKSTIKMLWCHEVAEFIGSSRLEKVRLFCNKTGKKVEIDVDFAVICIGSVPPKDCIQNFGLKMDGACVKVDDNGMTRIQGLFAAGDIVSSLKRIPQALASGEKAAYAAYKIIKNPYWK